MVQLHHHSRALLFRFVFIFFGTFLVVFAMLNYRFVLATVQYQVAPGTIRVADSINEAVGLLPIAKAKELKVKPLPDRARLVIDSLGVDAPLVFNVSADNKQIYDNLENGIVHYSITPKPSQPGVSVVLGHSSAYPWYRGEYGSVFALLGRLKPGEKFYVQYEDGRTFVFQMKQAIVFNPFAADTRLAELGNSDKPTIILISCYPVGTNYRRIAVQAELVTI